MIVTSKPSNCARGFIVRALALAAVLSGVGGCAAVDVIDPWRTDYVPRYHLGDSWYDFDVRVVDHCDHPIDGLKVRLRGIRKLDGDRNAPETEFYLFGVSGDAGEPGLVRFHFPAPSDPRALDLYAVLYESDRDVHSTHYFPGKYGYLKWAHHEVDLGKDRFALVHLSPDDV
ncbi:MAG: hypothetical protein IPK07_08995 [Deltaproteobacteria bacterium]|nr:hypothetical protein [Deltaproteobacteria bacterium]